MTTVTYINGREPLNRPPFSGEADVIAGPWMHQRDDRCRWARTQLNDMFGETADVRFERMLTQLKAMHRQRRGELTEREQYAISRLNEAARALESELGAPALLTWLTGATAATVRKISEDIS